MIVRLATYADWLAMSAALGMTTPRGSFRRVLTQMAVGPAWVFLDGANLPPVALGGIVREPACSEAWCVMGPAAAKRVTSLAYLARGLLDGAATVDPRPIVARVQANNTPGRRFVASIGFELSGRTGTIEIWRRL